jgi:pyruvate-formate lyase
MDKTEKIAWLAARVGQVTKMDPHHGKPLRQLSEGDLESGLEITRVFRSHLSDSVFERELAVLEVLFRSSFEPLGEQDFFVGRFRDGAVGFTPELNGSFVGFYALEDDILRQLSEGNFSLQQRREAEELLSFWRAHSTHAIGWREAYRKVQELVRGEAGLEWPLVPEHSGLQTLRQSSLLWFITDTTHRVAGLFLDGEKLVNLGLNGLLAEIAALREKAADARAGEFYRAAAAAIGLLKDQVIPCYAAQAEKLGKTELAQALGNLRERPPQTLFEALQLVYLYISATRIRNIGRIDVWFGPLYQAELEAGTLDPERAQTLVDHFWQLLYEEGHNFNTRVILGGKDRPNPAAADRFAMLCLEATRRLKNTRPQTTLRIYRGMNAAVYEKALDVIAAGCTFPMLLNDDVNIPAVARAFDIPEETAAKYVPLGCGEFTVEHTEICSPNTTMHLVKCLEYALHNGRDALTGHQIGPKTGAPEELKTFDALWQAFVRQVEFFMEIVALWQDSGIETVRAHAPFLLLSALYDDCLKKGRPLLEGIRYLDASTEVNSVVNAGDSLHCIAKLVFDQRRLSLSELVAALDADFAGYGQVKQWIDEIPKYGNDDSEADAMVQRVHDLVCEAALSQSPKLKQARRFLATHVNNHAHVQFGAMAAASADGRHAHEPFANANNPAQGRDVNGVTAMLSSLAKLRADHNAGMIQNMKFAPRMFGEFRDKTRALLQTYFDLGGTQATIAVVSRGDLEAAMAHPEKYPNLIVRVGGYSARFVELSREVQLEILHRTLAE